NYRNVPTKGCNDYFCKKPSPYFNVQVDEDLFLRNDHPDSIWARAMRLPVSTKKYYHYSDVNYFVLQKVVENLTQQPLDYFVSETFYHPLGLRRTTFKPSIRFEKWQIVPTEQDRLWRKDLVHGYVHDPAAALLGGVAGSAGVFANAEDLAALFQMMLNEGNYGGAQFFQPETVQEFAIKKHGIHRGFGFDKPVNRRFPTYSPHVSPETYGHTGFTGTCVWVDPKSRLVYVFLSNRVHPNARNGKIFTEGIRSRIHEVVYDAMGTFEGVVPELSIESEILEGE
ncbi:MAG: serine hydrolase, partial [Bacteroidota bacterium]